MKKKPAKRRNPFTRPVNQPLSRDQQLYVLAEFELYRRLAKKAGAK